MAEAKTAYTQRNLEKATGYSLGTINRTMKELTEAGYAANGAITNNGINALEPFRAKRAVFIAAGFGTRLVLITFNIPKPLVRIHVVRIINRLIDACLETGINFFRRQGALLGTGSACVSERALCSGSL